MSGTDDAPSHLGEPHFSTNSTMHRNVIPESTSKDDHWLFRRRRENRKSEGVMVNPARGIRHRFGIQSFG